MSGITASLVYRKGTSYRSVKITLPKTASNVELRKAIQQHGKSKETFIAFVGHPETSPELLKSERAIYMRRASDWAVAGTWSEELSATKSIPKDQSSGDSWLVFRSESRQIRVVRVDLKTKKPITSEVDIAGAIRSLFPEEEFTESAPIDKSGPNIMAFVRDHILPGEQMVSVIGHYQEELTPEVAQSILRQRSFEDVLMAGDAIEPKVTLRLVGGEE
ncbi:MAG: hypothetical protein WCV91_00350 [Candidatus Margulisiibacteriota bacterium]